MPERSSIRGTMILLSTTIAAGPASAATAGIPMTGGDSPQPWFDWILFGILVPWLLLAIWDYVNTRRSE